MSFDTQNFWQSEFAEHAQCMQATQKNLQAPFTTLLYEAATTIENGGKILFFGNGGSAADAQHLATELTVRYKKDRAPIAAIALTTDTSALSAIGNDLGFEYLFSRQVEALGRKGDLAIGISTSGNSANVIKALESCRAIGITTVGFTGETGGKMPPLCDILLNVPCKTTARIQEMHIMLGQMLCGALEMKLGLAPVETGTLDAQKVAV